MHPESSPDHDASSSCSAASPGGDSPARRGQHPPPDSLCSASMDSSQDPETSASDSFVPTVTAISTSPDLRWMVQPTTITTSTSTTTDSDSLGGDGDKARSKDHTAHGKKGKKDQPSKEEEERRTIRRERNKIAAAKCRNRRRELTDTLQAETDALEEEKAALQTEIADLLKEKERLEHVLATHTPACTLPPHEDHVHHHQDHDHDDHDDDVVDDAASAAAAAAAAAEMDDELELEAEEEEVDDGDDGGDDDDDDVSPMQQDPPASPPPPPLLSMLTESESLSEGSNSSISISISSGGSISSMALLMDGPEVAAHLPCPAAAILGNSNILLCSSAEEEEEVEEVEEEEPEPLEDLKGDDLDDLVPSLEMTAPEDEVASAAASVPDIDLGGAFGLPDWETLYRSVASDLETLSTPLVSSSPTCGGGYRSVFSFSGSEIDSLQMEDDCKFTKDSLNSPTLLAL